MRTVALWKTLNGARFVECNRVSKVEVSSNVAKVYFKDGDVEAIRLVDYKMPEGEHVGFAAQLALKDLRAYAEKIAEAVGKKADELEDGGRADVAAILKALLDLELFALLGWIYGYGDYWRRVVGKPALRVGRVELSFPVKVEVDSFACAHGSLACKLSRRVLVYPDLAREVRNVWLTVATGHWKYALEWASRL